MHAPREIAISDYDYPLPEERIAKYPLAQRDHSKLLHYKNGEIEETVFYHLPELLKPGTLLVFNNTKVIHARLLFHKPTGATIEVFCLEPWGTVASESFAQRQSTRWLCLIGNNKRWKDGKISSVLQLNDDVVTLTATRLEARGESWVVEFSWTGGYSFAEVIEAAGVIPLPPYLHRQAEDDDYERYQTVYALHEGSVAAPTAGLHFTNELLSRLKADSIDCEYITLQVGAGTFKPVSSATIGGHEMHVEQIQISRGNIEAILEHDEVIPVGTTTVRTLESFYWLGVKLAANPGLDELRLDQWDCYTLGDTTMTVAEAYGNVLQWMDRRQTTQACGATQLLIAPGYKYRVVRKLITNFHQPKSTLLLLVSALVGDDWQRCYRFALDNGFRFLSYGDSCFFEP